MEKAAFAQNGKKKEVVIMWIHFTLKYFAAVINLNNQQQKIITQYFFKISILCNYSQRFCFTVLDSADLKKIYFRVIQSSLKAILFKFVYLLQVIKHPEEHRAAASQPSDSSVDKPVMVSLMGGKETQILNVSHSMLSSNSSTNMTVLIEPELIS